MSSKKKKTTKDHYTNTKTKKKNKTKPNYSNDHNDNQVITVVADPRKKDNSRITRKKKDNDLIGLEKIKDKKPILDQKDLHLKVFNINHFRDNLICYGDYYKQNIAKMIKRQFMIAFQFKELHKESNGYRVETNKCLVNSKKATVSTINHLRKLHIDYVIFQSLFKETVISIKRLNTILHFNEIEFKDNLKINWNGKKKISNSKENKDVIIVQENHKGESLRLKKKTKKLNREKLEKYEKLIFTKKKDKEQTKNIWDSYLKRVTQLYVSEIVSNIIKSSITITIKKKRLLKKMKKKKRAERRALKNSLPVSSKKKHPIQGRSKKKKNKTSKKDLKIQDKQIISPEKENIGTNNKTINDNDNNKKNDKEINNNNANSGNSSNREEELKRENERLKKQIEELKKQFNNY
ncbi:protein mtl1-related [Anaeramoeba flamelloides]|uniref:Protein mtl1-related n=1 Tax=Anaeramoeba flamelloides TaxID=1746091 RepID=A0AAV7Y3Y0_9EUKA|nr:protein mtl1-related [Anaeramoeba flamelloides]